MTRHYLTMTTNDGHDHLRCACACGYESMVPVGPEDPWEDLRNALLDDARAWHAERGLEVAP